MPRGLFAVCHVVRHMTNNATFAMCHVDRHMAKNGSGARMAPLPCALVLAHGKATILFLFFLFFYVYGTPIQIYISVNSYIHFRQMKYTFQAIHIYTR